MDADNADHYNKILLGCRSSLEREITIYQVVITHSLTVV